LRLRSRALARGQAVWTREDLASTVAYYESARPPYGAEFFAAVAHELGFDGSQRLLDVGSGPGLLAIGFAPYCGEAVGVDPEPAMVEAARAAAKRAGVKAKFIEGRFEDVGLRLGSFDVVTIGRAIHWLDPEPARRALDHVVPPGGRVLICNATSVKDGRNSWLEAFETVLKHWKDDRPKRDHHAFFAGRPFVPHGTIRVETAHAVPIERLADRVLSMSTSSTERLGDKVPAMRTAVREALKPFAAGGMIEDTVEARAEVFERV
jgi:SAM-dependent methyltransferase